MKWAKRAAIGVVILAVLAVVVWGFLPKPAVVDTATIARGQLSVTIDEEGRTRVRDRFVIFAPVAGRMDRITLKPGDAVEAGAVVTRLWPLPPQPLDARARAQAEANIKAAEANRQQAQKQQEAAAANHTYASQRLENLRALLKNQNTSKDSVDAAEAQFNVTEANQRSAEFAKSAADYQLEAAKAALIEDSAEPGSMLEVRSPVAGQVLRVMRDSQGPVMAGEALLEIGDPRSLEVVTDMLSRDAVRILPRMKARLERWGGKETLNALVRHVEPSGFTKISALGVEEQRVNVVIDFADGPASFAALGDGFRVEVRVILEESLNVLKAPAGAVFTTKEGPAVFLIEGGIANRKQIQTGRRNGLEVEVVSGVGEGALVILHPSDAVSDGKAVIPR